MIPTSPSAVEVRGRQAGERVHVAEVAVLQVVLPGVEDAQAGLLLGGK
jgi:hypothetical protein